MSNEYLSQEEVDALLKGVTGEADEPAEAAPAQGVRPYNLATEERIVRGRMPALETINERLVRALRTGMGQFMRRAPEATLEPIRTLKYGDFLRNLMVPTNLNIVHMKPLRGAALIIFEPALIFAVVDSLFGGDGRFHTRIEGREFTATEQRIIGKLLAIAMDCYAKSWQPIRPLDLEFVRSESHVQFANIVAPSEVVIVTSVKMELGSSGGSLHVCMPYSMIEPIRDVLNSTVQGDGFEPDRRWMHMLKSQVQLAEVELTAELARISIPVKAVLGMRVGDVLSLDLPQRVVASVDGVPLFECQYGTASGQYAIRVERILAGSQRDAAMGEQHV